MRFPGSKLLSENLSTSTTSFDSLIRHCEDVNLSGYIEVSFSDVEGLILLYLGEQITVICRVGCDKFYVGRAATLKLHNTAQFNEGNISIYELPLDMAHMLRGLSNREEIFGQIRRAAPLREYVTQLEKSRHTGSLEILTDHGSGMVFLVRGRFSNAYFETEAGVTFEKKEALNKIYERLDSNVSAQVFKSDFSALQWKKRQHAGKARMSRLTEILEQRRSTAGDVTSENSGK